VFILAWFRDRRTSAGWAGLRDLQATAYLVHDEAGEVLAARRPRCARPWKGCRAGISLLIWRTPALL